jgi:hypothetical protein
MCDNTTVREGKRASGIDVNGVGMYLNAKRGVKAPLAVYENPVSTVKL